MSRKIGKFQKKMKVSDMTANNPSYGRVFNSFQEVCNFLDADVPPNQYVPAKTAEVRQATESEAPTQLPSFKPLTEGFDAAEWEENRRLKQLRETPPAPMSGETRYDVPTAKTLKSADRHITTDSINPDNYGRALGVDRNKGRAAMAQARSNVEARDNAAVERAGQRFREGKARAAQDNANRQAAQAAQGQTKTQAKTTPKDKTLRQQRNDYAHKQYQTLVSRFQSQYGRSPNNQENQGLKRAAVAEAQRQYPGKVVSQQGTQASSSQVAGM